MALVRWKWVDYLNIELYEHNLTQRETHTLAETQTYYESDEELFFERMNSNNLQRFIEANILRHRMALQRQYIIQEQQRLVQLLYRNTYRTPHAPPAYTPMVRW